MLSMVEVQWLVYWRLQINERLCSKTEDMGQDHVVMAPASHARDWRTIVAWENFCLDKLGIEVPKNIVAWTDFFPALKKLGYKIADMGDF